MPWAAKHLTARVEEARGGRALLVGEHFGVGHPRAIVDEALLVTITSRRLARLSSDDGF